MPRALRRSLAPRPIISCAAILATTALALQPAARPARAAEPAKTAASAAAVPGLRGDVIIQLNDAEKKLTALAQVTPAAKYTWRPAPGVRSVGEVFLHVAGGNYLFSSLLGATKPAGADPRSIEKDGADKDKTLAVMKASFEQVRNAISALNDQDLERPVDFFGRKATVRQVVLISAVHAHEHLGQSIAYARVNSIVPPWSEQPAPKPSR